MKPHLTEDEFRMGESGLAWIRWVALPCILILVIAYVGKAVQG